jgi:hypothetical protein
MRSQYEIGARRRCLAVGVDIPADTEDVRLAIKREIFTRGLTLSDVAARIGLSYSRLKHTVGKKNNPCAIHPGELNRIIAAVHITPAVARRLHLLAAREAGWSV